MPIHGDLVHGSLALYVDSFFEFLIPSKSLYFEEVNEISGVC